MAFDLQKWLLNNEEIGDIVFSIKGEITEKQIIDSLELIEKKIEGASSKVRKKVYNILVECMQNLFHHSGSVSCNSGLDISGKYVFCMLIHGEQEYFIVAGNFINSKQEAFLSKHLSHINTLDNLGLKDMYKSILNNQEFSEKGGGGLGMVDICRKSGNKLDFDFYNCADDNYFFSLKINIKE